MAKAETPLTEEQTLDQLLKRVNEIEGNPERDFGITVAPTGISSFDQSTGVGGIPRSRISIFQGEEHSGKTLLLLSTIAQSQKAGGRCAFIDAEHALTPNFARLLGVDWEALVPFVRRPKTMDQAYDLIKEYCRSGLFDVVGWDSVTALTTAAAIESAAGSASSRAAGARMHSEELPKLVAVCHPRTAVIFINQMRENPNPPNWWKGGKLLYAPGGKALRHYASLIVEIKPGETYKKGDIRIGHRLKTYCAKNKVGIPFLKAEFDLMYADGLDLTTDMIDTAIGIEVIRQSGSWFYIPMMDLDTGEELEEKRFAGKAALEDAIRGDEVLREYVQTRIAAILSEE
jgi:recombination protein RecA